MEMAKLFCVMDSRAHVRNLVDQLVSTPALHEPAFMCAQKLTVISLEIFVADPALAKFDRILVL